jgi:predicted anti-sigma-YlaC factor YlaD
MKQCDEIIVLLPEYIDGSLDEKTAALVNEHLQDCNSCQKEHEELKSFLGYIASSAEPEPPENMKDEFLEMAELKKEKTTKAFKFPPWAKVAASVLIVAGTFVVGFFSGSKNKEIAQLQTEISTMKQQVMLAGLQDYSGPQRIQAVYDISSSGETSNQLVNALVNTMKSDKNVNVRLAAINALSGMIDKD